MSHIIYVHYYVRELCGPKDVVKRTIHDSCDIFYCLVIQLSFLNLHKRFLTFIYYLWNLHHVTLFSYNHLSQAIQDYYFRIWIVRRWRKVVEVFYFNTELTNIIWLFDDGLLATCWLIYTIWWKNKVEFFNQNLVTLRKPILYVRQHKTRIIK